MVVGAGVALAAPFAPGAFAPVSRPGLAGGGAGGVGAASPAGAPAAGRDGEDGTGAGDGDPAGPVSGAAL
ncbi:MAG: IPTL-CTERM sorting domain-containing protein, partial [Isosphaeraceae bacterium]